jgi:hypothetical protein
MSDDKQQQKKQPPKDEAILSVRVRPVEGRLYRHEVTRQPLTEEGEIPRTRAVERAIAAGDLEEVGASSAQQQAEAGGSAARPKDDTALTLEERRATREADVGRLEKERY